MNKYFFVLISALIISAPSKNSYSSEITAPNTFQSGQTLTAESLNQNFSTVYNRVNLLSKVAILEHFVDEANEGSVNNSVIRLQWFKRTINRLLGNSDFVTLNNSQFILTKGEYFVTALSPIRQSQLSQLRLRNISKGETSIAGLTFYLMNNTPHSLLPLNGYLNVSTNETFELQQYSFGSEGDYGIGFQGNDEGSVFLQIIIHKLSD